jgi:hypothetical protein
MAVVFLSRFNEIGERHIHAGIVISERLRRWVDAAEPMMIPQLSRPLRAVARWKKASKCLMIAKLFGD